MTRSFILILLAKATESGRGLENALVTYELVVVVIVVIKAILLNHFCSEIVHYSRVDLNGTVFWL